MFIVGDEITSLETIPTAWWKADEMDLCWKVDASKSHVLFSKIF
jgi:hypothetical protein